MYESKYCFIFVYLPSIDYTEITTEKH